MNKISAKNKSLEPINQKSKSIKHTENDIVNTLAGKQPHEIFEQHVNEETNIYAAQKNATASFNVEDIEIFNAILLLSRYHSFPKTRILWEK